MSLGLRLDHISLFVSDLTKSADFYGSVLQLVEIENLTRQPHIRWFGLDGGRAIHLISGNPLSYENRIGQNHICVATRDLDAAMAHLERLNVPFGGLRDPSQRVQLRADGVRQIYFRDPDGYWIEINEATAVF